MVDGNLPPVTLVKNHFLGIVEQGKFILDAFDCHKKDCTRRSFEHTLQHYSTTEKYLNEFLEE
jgi:hypothetical protein